MLWISDEYVGQLDLFIEDFASLETKNVYVQSNFGFCIGNLGNAKTTINNSTIEGITCFGDSVVKIKNSTVGGILISGNSNVIVENTNVSLIDLSTHPGEVVSLGNLEPRSYNYWNLHENQTECNVGYDLTLINTNVDNWGVFISCQSITTISNSSLWKIGIHFDHADAQVRDLRVGFQERWSCDTIIFENCLIYGVWELFFYEPSCTIVNSTIAYHAWAKTNVTLIQSTISMADYSNGSGILFCNGTTITCFLFIRSNLFVHGNIQFSPNKHTAGWASSNVSRNYNVIARDMSGNTMENVELTLHYQNDTVMWNGITDSLGKADFNVTFTDINYTNTLRLEAVKGNYSATMDVGFLSDTPVVLTMRYFADLNIDGTINIVDISIVAMAFGTKEGDENYNPIADLDGNNEINIIDISKVARHFGEKR